MVGYHVGRAVGGGGIKRLPEGTCEIQRMYGAIVNFYGNPVVAIFDERRLPG